MSEGQDPNPESEPSDAPADEPIDERDQRALDAMRTRERSGKSLPTGCLISIAILFSVFFLIVSVCVRH